MKNLVVCSFLLLCGVFSAQAQEFVKLEKATISSSSIEMLPTSNANEYKYVVIENYAGEFAQDAIKFMEENFNIHDFIALMKDKNYDSYLITISNEKGYLKASYDKDGNLERTSQKFKNIVLPADVYRELHRNNKGWRMVKNSYRASGNNNLLEKELYRIKLKNGKKSKVVKIDPRFISGAISSSN